MSSVGSVPAVSAMLSLTVLKGNPSSPFQATEAEHLHALLEVVPGACCGEVSRPQLSLILLWRHLADGDNGASLVRVSVLCIDYMALPANGNRIAAKGLREVVQWDQHQGSILGSIQLCTCRGSRLAGKGRQQTGQAPGLD